MAVAAHRVQSLTGTRLPGARVAEIQRAKILAAATQVLDEYGHTGTTISRITSRARVSRTCFYELFDDRDGCLAAILDLAAAPVERELAAAAALPFGERVRAGLQAILGLFDRDRALARVCVVEALRCGPVVIERRALLLARLAAALERGGSEHAGARGRSQLTAQALVGAVFCMLHTRIVRRSREPLADLVPDLLAMLLLPYQADGRARRPSARTVRSPRLAGALRGQPATGAHPPGRP
ncbi:MAG TPA: TetR family transcriptional regulator [Solirubrobacteraceae bacterium]|nr:TetR family transcriptional regulator [Solirubrobacteraceae bacterium]